MLAGFLVSKLQPLADGKAPRLARPAPILCAAIIIFILVLLAEMTNSNK